MGKDFRGSSIPGHSDLKTILGFINSGLVWHFYGMGSAQFSVSLSLLSSTQCYAEVYFFKQQNKFYWALKISLF